MVLFALLQFYAYSARPYYANSRLSGKDVRYYGGPLGIKAFIAAASLVDTVQGLVQAGRYMVASQRTPEYNTAVGLEPLRYGQASEISGTPPPYVPTNATYTGVVAPQREPSPSSMEYGTVDGYTPLPRRQF